MAKVKLTKEQMEELAVNAGVAIPIVTRVAELQAAKGCATQEALLRECQNAGIEASTSQLETVIHAIVIGYL